MDISLSRRALNFLRKAGPAALLQKLWVRLKRKISTRGWSRANEIDEQLYRAKLESLPVDDGHVLIPVLDFKMKVRVSDLGLSRQLILNGVRERDAVEYLRPFLPSFQTIIEIGANQGYYAIMEALGTGPDAKIYAFEPHPENISTFKMNAKLNGCAGKFADIVQGAVSDRTGIATLQVHHLSNWHSLSRVDLAGGWQGSLDVPTIKLDDYCRDHGIITADFVRMDVEGHEAEIIQGAAEILSNSPQCMMFVEIHTGLLRESGRRPEDLLQQIRSLGFNQITFCGNGKHYTSAHWEDMIRKLELLVEKYGNHLFFSKSRLGL